jgi:hypothetical protein
MLSMAFLSQVQAPVASTTPALLQVLALLNWQNWPTPISGLPEQVQAPVASTTPALLQSAFDLSMV